MPAWRPSPSSPISWAWPWIPILCGLLGGLLGLVSFYLLPIPDYPAGDPITAAAVGIVSGLAATGLHQAAKQLSKEAGGDA